MFKNLEISNLLFNLKSQINDKEDYQIINNLYLKYKSDINIDVNYTDRELYGSKYVFRNLLNSIYKEPECWDMVDENDTSTWVLDENLFDKIDVFNEKCNTIILKFSLLRIKNIKSNNVLSKKNSQLIQTIFLQEIQALINQTF